MNRLLPKILRPDLDRWCVRQRLHRRLEQAANITWLASAAGSGKTYLVAGYVALLQEPVVWLHLDPDDNDPATFFHYLRAAARAVRPRLRLPALRPEYRAGLPTFSRQYFRKLFSALPQSTRIVLDNFETLDQTSELHPLLAEAVLETPRDLSWIVLSRSEPPAAFSRLAAERRLEHIGFEDLSFSLDETRELAVLISDEANVDEEVIQALHQTYHGWAAGLMLAIGGKSSRGIATSDLGDAGDYFLSQVFSRLPEARRQFLMKTACIPEITPRVADELTEGPDAAQILRELAQQNHFTSRLLARGRPPTYRYHPLFRRFLCEQAEARMDAEELDTHLLHAAGVLKRTGQYEAAIELLRRLGRWEELCGVVRECADALLSEGRHDVVAGWLNDLPQSLRDDVRGWLQYYRAAARLPFDPVAAERDYRIAFDCLARSGDAEGIFLSWAGGAEALLYSFRSYRGFDFWLDVLANQCERFSPPSIAVEGRLTAMVHAAYLFRRAQDPAGSAWDNRARKFCELSRQLDPNVHVRLAVNILYQDLWLGRIAHANDLMESLRLVVRSRRTDAVTLLAWHTMCAVYGSLTGDPQSSLHAVESALELAQESGVHSWDLMLTVQGAFAAVALGDPRQARGYLARTRELLNLDRDLEQLIYQDASAQTALAEGDIQSALDSARRVSELCERVGSPISEIIHRIGCSQALFAAKHVEEALRALECAESLASAVGSPVLKARCALARAEYALELGQVDDARRHLAFALALCRRNGYYGTPWWRPDVMRDLAAFALSEDIEAEFVRSWIKHHSWTPRGRAANSPHWVWPVRVFAVDGPFRVVVSDKTLTFERKAQRRPLEFLQALIAFGGQDVAQSRISAALWPDSDGDTAAQAAATTLHRLRRLIGADLIQCRDQKLTLNRERCFVDALVCQEQFSDQRSSWEVRTTFRLYTRSFLWDSEVSWAYPFRQRLATRYVHTAERLAQIEIDAGRSEAARALYEYAIEAEPGVESLHQSLIRLLSRMRRHAAAADAYRRCERSLRLHHKTEPSDETRTLARGTGALRTQSGQIR